MTFRTEIFQGTKPRQFVSQASATCCIVRSADKLLILRKTRTWPGLWTCPGGKLDQEESPQVGALRELSEETGIDAKAQDIVSTPTLYVRSQWGTYDLHCFKINFDSQPLVILNSEHDQYQWLHLSDALNLPMIPAQKEVLEHCLKSSG